MRDKFINIPTEKWLLQTLVAGLLITLVSSCDSGGSAGVQPPEDPGQQSEEQDTQTEFPHQLVSVGTSVTDSLVKNNSKIYRVPEDTEIILTTQSGDADIYLHETEELTDDTVLCIAKLPFKEDNCRASSTGGELYATVLAAEDSTYTISATSDCSVESINRWVYRSMQDYYLFADQVPTVNPDTYSDPTVLINDLRYSLLDPYSRVEDSQPEQAFLDEGISFDFGAGFYRDAEDNMRIAYVYDDSVFGRSGVKRGDIVTSIGGVPSDQITGAIYDELVGTDSDPLTVVWVFIDGDTSEVKTIAVAKGEFNINTVLYVDHYAVAGFSGRIGYLVFKNFLRISEDELDRAIGELAEAGVNELVLDLRYNNGGYGYIARRLAAQIGGPSLTGKRATNFEFNSSYADLNYGEDFVIADPSLNLSRLVVLTREGTASASELLINSLRPYMEVVSIGEISEGKAFGSYGIDFCGKRINAMSTQYFNVDGVSVVDGIPADCHATDDLSRNFGLQSNAAEGMLQSALDYVTNGTCNTAPMIATSRTGERFLPDDEMPFIDVVNDSGRAPLAVELVTDK